MSISWIIEKANLHRGDEILNIAYHIHVDKKIMLIQIATMVSNSRAIEHSSPKRARVYL
jgi:hypothetical protein